MFELPCDSTSNENSKQDNPPTAAIGLHRRFGDASNGSNVESVTCNGTTERERKKQIRYIRTAARTSFVLIKVLNKDELKSSFFQNLSSEFSLGVFVGYPVVIRVVQSAT